MAASRRPSYGHAGGMPVAWSSSGGPEVNVGPGASCYVATGPHGEPVYFAPALLSGLDDRDHLAFGHHLVDRDQDGFQPAARGRGDRNLHFHGFDDGDVVAIVNARTCCNGKGANAPGDFSDDSDIWHANRLLVVGRQCLR